MGTIYKVVEFKELNFGATGVEEILQNVAFIISTHKDTCVLDREFGWTPVVDIPIQLAEQMNISRIVEAIQIFEPRASIEKIRTSGEYLNGNLKIEVSVIINDE